MQWVFDCCESDLEEYYWKYSYYELKKRVELKIGHATAAHMAVYSTLVEVAAIALGKKDEGKAAGEDLTHLSPEAQIARINQLTSI